MGHGYLAAQDPQVSGAIAERLFATAGHAHSGYIDLLYNVGLVGTMLFLVPIIWTLLLGVVRVISGVRDAALIFCVTFIFSALVVALFDVTIFGIESQLGSVFLAIILICRGKLAEVSGAHPILTGQPA